MSHQATTWAFAQDVRGPKRTVLVELANCHNAKTGRCDPAVKRNRENPTGRSLNEITEIGERKLGALLAGLEADALLIRQRRHWKANGWRANDQFHLAINGIEQLRDDLEAGRVWNDERMNPKASERTPRDDGSKASEQAPRPAGAKASVGAVPKRPFVQVQGVTRGGAIPGSNNGEEEPTTPSSSVPKTRRGGGVPTGTAADGGNGVLEWIAAVEAEHPELVGRLSPEAFTEAGEGGEGAIRRRLYAELLKAQGVEGTELTRRLSLANPSAYPSSPPFPTREALPA